MAGESEIESIDDCRIRDDGGISVVGGGVNLVVVGKSVGRSKFGTRENLPDNIEVLEEERPAGLLAREFTRVLDIG